MVWGEKNSVWPFKASLYLYSYFSMCCSTWLAGTAASSSQQASPVFQTTGTPNTGEIGLIPSCEVPHRPGTGQGVTIGSTPSVFLRSPINLPLLSSGSTGDLFFELMWRQSGYAGWTMQWFFLDANPPWNSEQTEEEQMKGLNRWWALDPSEIWLHPPPNPWCTSRW